MRFSGFAALRLVVSLICLGNGYLAAEQKSPLYPPRSGYPYVYPYNPYYTPTPPAKTPTPAPVDSKKTPPVAPPKPAPPPKEEPLGLPTALSAAPVAPLYSVCGNNYKTRLWAQYFVDADLMQVEVARLKVPKSHTKIAVLDTGFDVKGNKAHIVSPVFEAKPGFKDAGPHEEDKDSHGTMVAGVIGGKNGMGVAPDADLTVYRVTTGTGGGSTSNANLQAAARKACEEGHSIINMSWGGLYDEVGEKRDEVSEKKFIDWLAHKGCLLVKSAGNSAYRAEHATNALDDAYLRVAAVVGSGTLSPFSTRGEVQAPGSYVFTLQSKTSGTEPATENAKLCSGSDGRFVNGTSFAAPITAAVAAQVSGVLYAADPIGFDHLNGPGRITLINRVLKASEIKGSISGLRAVLIAERWAKDLNRPLPTVEALAQTLVSDPPAFCSDPAQLTLDPKKPEAFATLARKRLAVCPAYAPNEAEGKKLALRLVAALARAHNMELALRWLAPFDEEFWKLNPKGSRELSNYLGYFLERKWQANTTYSMISFGVDVDESLTFLPIYLASRGVDAQSVKETEAALSSFLGSWDLRERLSRRPLRGSEEDFARLRIVWRLASQKLGSAKFLSYLEKYASGTIDRGSRYLRPNSKDVLIAFRILTEMIEDPYFENQKTQLEKIEWMLFEKTNATNRFEMEKVASEKLDLIHIIVFGSDMNQFHVRYLDSFVKRHWKKIEELTNLSRHDFDATKLGPFFTAYFLTADLAVAPEWRAEWKAYLGIKTLETISRREGWNDLEDESWTSHSREDQKFAALALEAILDGYKRTARPEWKKWITENYRRIFSQNKNYDVFASQLKSMGSDWTISSYLWRWTFEHNPLMTKELAHAAAVRVFHSIPHLSPKVRFREAMGISDAISNLAPYLVSPEFLVADAFLYPLAAPFRYWDLDRIEITDPSTSRLRANGAPASASRLDLGTEIVGVIEDAIDSWAGWMLTLNAEQKKDWPVARVMKAFRDSRPLCVLLSPKGKWRKNVSELYRVANNARYNEAFGSNNFEVMWASKRLLENCK